MTSKIDYKSSGVDVQAGDALVEWLQSSSEAGKSKSKTPYEDHIVSGIGGFASLFRFPFAQMKKPCLVTCTDGVGTKVKIASAFGRMESIGQDLVAMCVNDLVCTGGKPLLFLDYYATGKLELEDAKKFLHSVREACHESNCALVGGETAEMPGVYAAKDFDCAGFAVGVVDEDEAWGPKKVKAGDILIGVASSGFHSNGYSLLRKVFEKDLAQYADELLKPTALYVKMCEELSGQVKIHAAAHITGGGIENIPRVLPEFTRAVLTPWEMPPLFLEVQKRTGMSTEEMRGTLNCGLGFVFILPAEESDRALSLISKHHPAWRLGRVETFSEKEPQVSFEASR